MIYCAATLTFSFTDATYIAIKKYSIGPYWISIIVIALVIDFTALVVGTLYSSGKLANNYIQRRQRFRVQQELIRQGKLVFTKVLTQHELKLLAYKTRETKQKRKKKREKIRKHRALEKARRKALEEKERVATPQFSEGILEIQHNFDQIFHEDREFWAQAGILSKEEQEALDQERRKPIELRQEIFDKIPELVKEPDPEDPDPLREKDFVLP